MSYRDRPWLARYEPGMPRDVTCEYDSALAMFEAAVARTPDAPAITYFDTTLDYAELDARATALAAGLLADGFAPGDRLALYLQNQPAFVIGLVASWKAGGCAVSINPMNKARELEYLLADSGATALLCLDELYRDVAREVIESGGTAVTQTIACSAHDLQGRGDERVLPPAIQATVPTLAGVVESHRDVALDPVTLGPDDIAFLTYTSGTTGEPKGATNTHRNVVNNSQVYRDWCHLGPDDSVLGLAPLFHITGLIAGITTAMLIGAPLVLSYRFHPQVMLDSIREHQPTFTVGAITAFIALCGAEGASAEDFASLRVVYSGGAPIAPAVARSLHADYGLVIHNVYGLTETTSPSHAVPFGAHAPVDPESGALSVGVPVFGTTVRVVDPDGTDLPPGEVGELLTSGPGVVPRYWNKPAATEASLPGGELHTGDVGFMDADGWFYLVDRLKDMIVASGYKVWPREVEDVLYGHPAIREAAVVGVPDDYRGETVRAFVSLKPGQSATEDEIIAYAKANMAAYKYPRSVVIMDELPKTATGKILRRSVRDQR